MKNDVYQPTATDNLTSNEDGVVETTGKQSFDCLVFNLKHLNRKKFKY